MWLRRSGEGAIPLPTTADAAIHATPLDQCDHKATGRDTQTIHEMENQ